MDDSFGHECDPSCPHHGDAAMVEIDRLNTDLSAAYIENAEQARRLAAVIALTDHVAEGDGWGKCDNTWVTPDDVRAAATGEATDGD
jgi:hypothetical protein